MKYEQAKPLLDELCQLAVMYHASRALRTKLFDALNKHIPHLDEGCFERGCPMDETHPGGEEIERNQQVLKASEQYFKVDKGKPIKQAVSNISTDDLNAQAKEIHKGRPYAELSLEERVDLLILFWKTSLIEWDPNSTALMHETYKNDPVLYNTVLMIDTFIAHLENLKGQS